jgi:hypothetical protein
LFVIQALILFVLSFHAGGDFRRSHQHAQLAGFAIEGGAIDVGFAQHPARLADSEGADVATKRAPSFFIRLRNIFRAC